MERRTKLRITGCPYPERLDEILSSDLVDVAYFEDPTEDGAWVVADDLNWPADSQDYEWLCSVIRETLAARGIVGVGFKLVSQRDKP